MNKIAHWLITIYIISILAWSGLLKAEEVTLTNVSFNPTSYKLVLEGLVVGACKVEVKSQIENSIDSQSLVRLSVVGSESVSFCLPEESTRLFNMVLDVRSFGLLDGFSYLVQIDNLNSNKDQSMQFHVDIPALNYFPSFNSMQSSGVLHMTGDGQWFVVTNQENIISLRTEIDLSKYVGQRVQIEGTEILHLTGPELLVEEHNPLRVNQSKKGPEVFLLSISSATL